MPNQPIVNASFLYVKGFELTYTSGTVLTVSAGEARDSTDTFDIEYTASTLSTAVTGANGLDTGAMANNTWYAVWALGDSHNFNNGAVMLSTSFTAPVMPSGYDGKRLIGVVKTDGAAAIIKFYQVGSGSYRRYVWDVRQTALLNQGSATYDALSLSAHMPTISRLAHLNWQIIPNVAGDAAEIRPTGSTSTANAILHGSVASVSNSSTVAAYTNASQSIDWVTTSADDDLSIYVLGFEYFV